MSKNAIWSKKHWKMQIGININLKKRKKIPNDDFFEIAVQNVNDFFCEYRWLYLSLTTYKMDIMIAIHK